MRSAAIAIATYFVLGLHGAKTHVSARPIGGRKIMHATITQDCRQRGTGKDEDWIGGCRGAGVPLPRVGRTVFVHEIPVPGRPTVVVRFPFVDIV